MVKKAAKPDLRVVVDNSTEMDAAQAAAEHIHPESPEQVEMPFAIVNGEAITQLPKDLYIPPQALEVFLEAFEGPLDLLLYMIRRQNLDILDIPIADITRQYMDYIGLMADLQLELAGEYLVMAATLAEIKSRMLLPRATDPNAGEDSDPRADLVRRLQEYERFKSAAESIDRIVEEVTGMRQRAQEYEDNPEQVRGIIAEGCEKAREVASSTLDDVKQAMGLTYR